MPLGSAGAAVRAGQRVIATRGLRSLSRPRVPYRPSPPRQSSAFPELDAVRALLPPAIGAWAEWRASSLDMGADRALIAAGFLDEDAYLRAYAKATGIAFEPLTDIPRFACPVDDAHLLTAAAAGLLPLRIGDDLICVVAPRGIAAREIAQRVARQPELRRRFRMTSTARLNAFTEKHAGDTLGAQAADALRTNWPALSAAPSPSTPAWPWWPPLLSATVVAAIAAPNLALATIDFGFSLLFLAWMLLRLTGLWVRWPEPALPGRIADAELPVYTVIAALYREAGSVADLVASIERLDWPVEKLDVKIVIEPDDAPTREAVARLTLDPRFEILLAPGIGPRTKPKALNAALPFARGTFTVIYDAEDRPEPDQLRVALDAFLAQDHKLACVQAALTIDNTADSWLARGIMAQTPQAA